MKTFFFLLAMTFVLQTGDVLGAHYNGANVAQFNNVQAWARGLNDSNLKKFEKFNNDRITVTPVRRASTITIENVDALKAAKNLLRPGKKVSVLNLANKTVPGGV